MQPLARWPYNARPPLSTRTYLEQASARGAAHVRPRSRAATGAAGKVGASRLTRQQGVTAAYFSSKPQQRCAERDIGPDWQPGPVDTLSLEDPGPTPPTATYPCEPPFVTGSSMLLRPYKTCGLVQAVDQALERVSCCQTPVNCGRGRCGSRKSKGDPLVISNAPQVPQVQGQGRPYRCSARPDNSVSEDELDSGEPAGCKTRSRRLPAVCMSKRATRGAGARRLVIRPRRVTTATGSSADFSFVPCRSEL